jgi:hypothetical protein
MDYKQRREQQQMVNPVVDATAPIQEYLMRKWAESHRPLVEGDPGAKGMLPQMKRSAWELLNDGADYVGVEDMQGARDQSLKEALKTAKQVKRNEIKGPLDEALKGSAWDLISREGHGF